MKFLRLPDPLISVLLENDDIIAVDKPYGFNSHTNDSKIAHSDFIQDGLIEIFEKQLGQKLHIIHRLDQTTTGVIIFGKSQDSAKKYAEYFFDREVKKTYWFITASQSQQSSFLIDQEIVHKGRELEAKTLLTFLKRSKSFELWQANPYTGRNHQIRIHAKVAALSILGDPKYGGEDFPFLCLHNHRIEFPNGIIITSPAPVYFDKLELLEDRVLAGLVFEMDRRQRLFPNSVAESFRWIDSKTATTQEGTSLDQWGDRLLLTSGKETQAWGSPEQRRFTTLASLAQKPLMVSGPGSKTLFPTNSDVRELAPAWTAKEAGFKFECTVEHGAIGISLNQRLQRHWLQSSAENKTVLSVFAGGCGFGLAAARGRAKEVVSVEANKVLLNTGKRNFELNALSLEPFRFYLRDSLVFLKQTLNKDAKFDIVCCEAPSFFRGEKGIFKIENDLELLLSLCVKVVSSKGVLLFSTSSEKLFIEDIKKALARLQRSLPEIPFEFDCIQPSFDFGLPDDKISLKAFLIRRTT